MPKHSTNYAMKALNDQRGQSEDPHCLDDLRDLAQSSFGEYTQIYISAPLSNVEEQRMESRAYSLLSVTDQRKVDEQRLQETIAQQAKQYKR